MPALSTSENLFHSPICRSIGTMGLQTSICPPFNIPDSLKNGIISFRNMLLFFEYRLTKIFLNEKKQADFPDQQLYV